MDFKNKVAVVTGGTGGLGRVIVSKLADAGMKVYVPVRDEKEFQRVFDSSADGSEGFKLRQIFSLVCDAFDEDQVKEFIGDVIVREGRVDYLVNTVGGFHPKKNIADMDTKLLEDQIKFNFMSTWYFTRNTLTSMIKNNYGRIVSIAAKPGIETTPGKFAYSVSKAGIVNLMQTIAEECKENNIRTAAIVPSIIDTPANRQSMPDADPSHWVSPEEIAKTIMYLCSDAAKSLRGSVVKMYGGV